MLLDTPQFDHPKAAHNSPYSPYEHIYSDDDDTSATGRTMSLMADEEPDQIYMDPITPCSDTFQQEMEDIDDSRIARYQNTYFMDGGNRFISLPSLGTTSTKAALHISRMFREWLENKIYHHPTAEDFMDTDRQDYLPIIEDSVELLAEDVLNKIKSRSSVRGLKGLSRVLLKIRTGHIYTYHQLEDGQPLITQDMEDFFQQFPLFVEVMIYIIPHRHQSTEESSTQVLLAVENITVNPNSPYRLMEEIKQPIS
ncbi:hypothetical protein CLU79DRAFT_804693 [Phycomyces nitens]|nr:hypothetical protein CLU79DRAFT_804693 [Phycomyces nitens]